MKKNYYVALLISVIASVNVLLSSLVRPDVKDVLLATEILQKATQLHESKKYEQELALLDAALILDNGKREVYGRKAQAYQALSDYQKAREFYELALENRDNSPLIYGGLAGIYSDAHSFFEGLEILDQGLQKNPGNIHLIFQRANLLNLMNRVDEALELYNALRSFMPDNYSVLYNIAFTYKKLGRIDEAIEIYNYLIEKNPENHQARFSRGMAYLVAGDFERGWIDYESRWFQPEEGRKPRNFNRPMWDGGEIEGLIFFCHAEQGLGDTLEFIRYARYIKQRGGRIIVAAQKPLIQLLKLCPYIDQVIGLQDPVPLFDVHVPLVSFPYLCKTRLDSIPGEVPYLYADESLVAYWKEQLSIYTGLKIGICWNGNSNYSTPMLRAIVAHKSIQLNEFEIIATIPGVHIFNLQKVTGLEQLDSCSFNLISFDESFDVAHGRFMDTAAVMKNLDLVITVDTSTAHLAGGLGIPVWVLLPKPADWRWLLDCEDTPWYPNMRLFRQNEPDNWAEVFKRVAKELLLLLQAQS